MSQVEIHIGRFKKVETPLSQEEFLKIQCNLAGFDELPSYHKTWKEFALHELDRFCYSENGDLYEVVERQSFDEGEDIQSVIKREDGTYSFVFQFYNGWTCFSEVLEDSVNKIKD